MRRVMQLPDHAQPVGGVPRQDVRVHGQSRFELRERQLAAQAEHLDAMPQHIQRTALVERIAQAVQ